MTISPAGARVPITGYICTQPNRPGFNDTSQCTVSSGLRTCETKEGGSPTLLDGESTLASGLYGWNGNTNPFVVLDIPQGWCVGSVVMTFQGNIPALSLSVHSSERLSNNTNRTMFSVVSEAGDTPVVVNFTTLACGRYLRINMTEDQHFFLTEIEVLGTSKCTHNPRNPHKVLAPLLVSLNVSSITDDTICTPPSSAGDNSVSPTTSVASSNHSVTLTCEYTSLMYIAYSSWYLSHHIAVNTFLAICSLQTHGGSQILQCIELCLHCTVCFPLADTSDNSTTSGPRLASSQSPSTPPSGGPVSPTTSVGSSNHSVTPTCEYTALMYIKYSSWYLSIQAFVLLTHGGRQILQ